MGEVGRTRGIGLGLQRVQAPPLHSRAQALAAHPVPVLAQFDLQTARVIAAL